MGRIKTGKNINCKECGIEKYLPASAFTKKYTPIFCSRECSAKNRIGENNGNWKGGDAEICCKNCDKNFFLKNNLINKTGNNYCSQECYSIYNSKVRKQKMLDSLIKKKCRACDNTFLIRPCRLDNNIYCSKKCYAEDMSIRRSGENSPTYKTGLFVKENRSKNYNNILKKSRATKNHTMKEWISMKETYNYTCPSCNKSEPEIRLEKDHIIPVSKGGHSGIDNIQPLCRLCNLEKNNFEIRFVNKFNNV